MDKKKKYIVIGSAILLILIIGFLFLNFNKKRESPLVIKQEQNQIKSDLDNEAKAEIPIQKIQKEDNTEISIDTDNIKVSLFVLGKTYKTNIKNGATVYDVMKGVQGIKENNFDFKYKEYPSLGIFIDEINGIKGTSGKYWIYYVNNTEASVGVSNYILKDGDSILWKQE